MGNKNSGRKKLPKELKAPHSAIEKYGAWVSRIQTDYKDKLTTYQLMALEKLIGLGELPKSNPLTAKALGIPERTYYSWLSDSIFRAAMQDVVRSFRIGMITIAERGLKKGMQKNNYRHLQLFYQLTGEINQAPRQGQQVNVQFNFDKVE